MPPITDPTAIPALAPVLREAVDELDESLETASRLVDEAGADVEVEVPSVELMSLSVEEAVIEVEVSSASVVMVVKRDDVVVEEDLSSDEQLPNMLWHLFKVSCQRHLKECRDYRGDLVLLGSS